MKHLVVVLVIITLFATILVPSFSQKKTTAELMVVKGEVVDVKCYIMDMGADGGKGKSHKDCAVRCANQGVPLAILEGGTNNVYFAVKLKGGSNANDMLLPFVAEMVIVRGKIAERGGVKLLLVKSIEKAE